MELASNEPGRFPWILTGDIVGNGPDHEPLVAEVEPIAWIGPTALKQARQRYHDCFDVGRASTD